MPPRLLEQHRIRSRVVLAGGLAQPCSLARVASGTPQSDVRQDCILSCTTCCACCESGHQSSRVWIARKLGERATHHSHTNYSHHTRNTTGAVEAGPVRLSGRQPRLAFQSQRRKRGSFTPSFRPPCADTKSWPMPKQSGSWISHRLRGLRVRKL